MPQNGHTIKKNSQSSFRLNSKEYIEFTSTVYER